jgi:hypothetical protein
VYWFAHIYDVGMLIGFTSTVDVHQCEVGRCGAV